MSTVMKPRNTVEKTALLQGTLDMLILRTLHAMQGRIQRDVLQVEHGSLYPALHRMERKGWIISKWEIAKERNREFKYYRLTPAGRKQLAREESKWKQLAAAVATVMWPAPGDPS